MDPRHNTKVESIIDRQTRCAEILEQELGDIIFSSTEFDIDYPNHLYAVFQNGKKIAWGSKNEAIDMAKNKLPKWDPLEFPENTYLMHLTKDGWKLANEPYKKIFPESKSQKKNPVKKR